MDSITEESARLFSDSLAGNTWKSYSRARSVLASFQLLYTLEKVWPVPVEQKVQFIAYLSLKHLSPATVRLYISGISFSHNARNLEDTTKNFVVSKMLEGLHRNHPQRDNRAPITLSLLRQITDALPSICTSTYESLLFKSSFILAFFAMLRVSEFKTKNKSDSNTEALQLSDVVLSDRQLKINIKKSKTDQRGHSTFIVINKYRDNASICPVLTLKKYLSARPTVLGRNQLFMHFDGSPLTHVDEVFASILRGFAPAVLETRTPIETIGDGNCLYRSVSTGLFGTQIFHHHLRLLTALEIINNKQQYDTSSKRYTDRIRDNRVVTSQYEQLVRNAVVIGAYSDMQHMYGLSAVINKPLQSYYPPLVSSNYHTEPYHRKIVGRTVNESEEAAVTIMWTMKVRPQPFAVLDPNHFVPLLRLHTPSSQFVDLDDSSDQDHTSNQSNAKSNKYNKEGTNQDHKKTDTSSDHHNRDNSSHSTTKTVILPTIIMLHTTMKDQTGESAERTFTDIFGESDPDESGSNTHNGSDNSSLGESVLSDNLSFFHNQRSNGSDDANDYLENGDIDSSDDGEKDDSVNEVSNSGMFQPKEQLKYGEFLNLEELLNKLRSKDVRHGILEGKKDNVCFTIDNSRRVNNLRSEFSDDCGVWISSSGSTPKTYYVVQDDGKLKAVVCRQGILCTEKQINKKKEFIPVDPQPADEKIVEISRSYSTLKQQSYKKRVPWVEKAPPSFEINLNAAVVEYKGRHPVFSAHGNSKNGNEFVRTPALLFEEIGEHVKTMRPKNAYNKLLINCSDEATGPSARRQIRDKKIPQ
ncbi:unnamed protein product [Mytilus coruscus]|uniref:OTU domain-containing protein n=1 Tax=Mytilus coruscus TaxID=42192 RepID=A0A6J8ADE6_MYTCO|nr:unnamed protein product [Mytilus coruscus]